MTGLLEQSLKDAVRDRDARAKKVLDALAALPEFGGNRTAVLRMLIAKNFAEKFPSGVNVGASQSKSGTSAPRKTGRKS